MFYFGWGVRGIWLTSVLAERYFAHRSRFFSNSRTCIVACYAFRLTLRSNAQIRIIELFVHINVRGWAWVGNNVTAKMSESSFDSITSVLVFQMFAWEPFDENVLDFVHSYDPVKQRLVRRKPLAFLSLSQLTDVSPCNVVKWCAVSPPSDQGNISVVVLRCLYAHGF